MSKVYKKFKENKKGAAAMVDVLMFSIISIVAITTLFVYAESHQISKIGDVQKQEMDEYTTNALLTLNHVTVDGDIKYSTVQPQAIKEVDNEVVSGIRDVTNELQECIETVDEIERTVDEDTSKLVDQIESTRKQIKIINGKLDEINEKVKKVEANMASASDAAENLCKAVNQVSGTFGGIFKECSGSVDTSHLKEMQANCQEMNKQLNNVDNKLQDYKSQIGGAKVDILKIIKEVKCTLISTKSTADHYLNYFELGVCSNASFIDLLPVEANLGGKTVSEITGESFYVRNNFADAGEDMTRPILTGGGLFFFRNKAGDFEEMAFGLALMGRRDLRDEGDTNVKNMTQKRLENLLSNQGYKYCYEAVDECYKCNNSVLEFFNENEFLEGTNRILISNDNPDADSCDYVKDMNVTYSFAHQPMPIPNNRRGEMRLYVWRKT